MSLLLASRAPAAALIAFAMPSPALAVPAATEASGAATLLRPLSLIKRADLDFGFVITSATAGTIVLNPVTNGVTTTGGVTAAPGVRHAARFTGAASGGPVVNIRLPNQPVTLTRVGGTQTVTLSNLTLDGPDKRSMARAGSFDFAVGGRLAIGANQTPGNYLGTFTVTVQYP